MMPLSLAFHRLFRRAGVAVLVATQLLSPVSAHEGRNGAFAIGALAGAAVGTAAGTSMAESRKEKEYVYEAPVVAYPAAPTVVYAAPAAPPAAYYYYCDNPAGYYPYVPSCLTPWRAVPAKPAGVP